MYQKGDARITVRELLLKAFLTGWRQDDRGLTQSEYVSSSIHVIETMQVDPESVYCEEGLGLNDGDEVDHLDDTLRADGVWLYYGVSAENFFLLQWMADEAAAQAKLAQLAEDAEAVCYAVDLSERLQEKL